ncbi:MAG: hypothetical protein ACXVB1_04545 [Pseudobdellovibrionaceae bacterium]
MASFKSFFIIFAVLCLSACAFDKSSNEDTQAEIENRNLLYEKYNRIIGVYHGQLTSGSSEQQVELSFYTIEVKIGDTSRGQPKFLPALMVRYRLLDNVVDDILMTATYLPENNGEIFMSNKDNTFGFSGRLNDKDLSGDVTKNGGQWGFLKASLFSHGSSAPNDANDRAERNARLMKIYEPIVGQYLGKVVPPPQQGQAFAIEVNITIDQVKDKDGFYVPALKADYKPAGQNDRNLALFLDIDYKSDTNPPYMSLVSQQAKGDYSVTMAGTLVHGVFRGTFTNKFALRADVTFRKRR